MSLYLRETDTMTRRYNGHAPPETAVRGSAWFYVLMSVVAITVIIALFRGQHESKPFPGETVRNSTRTDASGGLSHLQPTRLGPNRPKSTPTLTAEEIVTGKVVQFARSRREIARGIAARLSKELPAEIQEFFDAVESGKWEEIKARWDPLARRSGQYEYSTNGLADLEPYWAAVLDAYGVAEQAHLWPAQKLLDYGNAVLDSLRPGMVYVGGTDNGRWIPELLNETSGDQHIILTQNALADSRYLDWVSTLYTDRMTTLTSEDSQAAFQGYVDNAQKRFEHDQQFPDEPKQVRPGEDIRMVDGKIQVGGRTSVMAINERLLQTLMQKNPDLSFAIEESFPLKGTYADALPLGPLMELGVNDGRNTFTPERAMESLQYWQMMTQQLSSDPEVANSSTALKSYSHDAVSAANLLAAHNFSEEAEQAYNLATQLWPGNPESVNGLADVLVGAGREREARQLLDDFVRQYPDEQQTLQQMSAYWRLISPAHSQ